jgi:ATP-binding cassette subfamily F protein 3
MRIALAKALLEAPDILLLDEPTNYLDIEARTWLEQWLRSFPGGCILVSHDRYFLDVTVNEVYELFQGQLKRYAGNYTAYEQVRQAELENLLKRYAAQQEEIAKAEDLIRRFRYKATKAAMVQERIKKLEKMERIEIPESLKKISIRFPPPPHSGRIAMTLEGIGKSYRDRPVLGGIDLILDAGEKLVVVGRNGAGKTTLLRILAGEDQNFEGKLSYGAGIQPGYFSQDAAETMRGSQQVLEYLEAEAPTELIPRVRDMLGAFLFRGDDVYKPISVLSGGEKSRLALLRMLLKPMNLLILDEPTNHLDLHSKDILLETLKSYNGTIIFVSHDRAFMEALSTKTLELSAQGSEQAAATRLFYGGYGYYLDRIAREPTNSITVENSNTTVPVEPSLPEKSLEPVTRNSLPGSILIKAAERRELSKQRQTLIRRLEREEEEILKALEKLEAEKAALEAELAQPKVYSSGEKARAVKARLNGVTVELEGKSREWESVAAELERAKIG